MWLGLLKLDELDVPQRRYWVTTAVQQPEGPWTLEVAIGAHAIALVAAISRASPSLWLSVSCPKLPASTFICHRHPPRNYRRRSWYTLMEVDDTYQKDLDDASKVRREAWSASLGIPKLTTRAD